MNCQIFSFYLAGPPLAGSPRFENSKANSRNQ
jgi:hypothetical protein